jgi:hypothetical protein
MVYAPNLFGLFNPKTQSFPRTGNLIGHARHLPGFNWHQTKALHLPTEYRQANHLCVQGGGHAFNMWIADQMRQDIMRGEGLLCYDPHGQFAHDVINIIAQSHVKRVLWIDLDDASRYITLNPADPCNARDDADFYEWCLFLFSLLPKMRSEEAECVDLALRALHFGEGEDYDQRLTIMNLLHFLQDEGYRRYVLSTYRFGAERALRGQGSFESTFRLVVPTFRELLASNQWRGTLGATTRIGAEKTLPDFNIRDHIVVITGQPSGFGGLSGEIWRFGFFQHVKRWLMDSDADRPFQFYGFDGQAFDQPCLDPLMAKGPEFGVSVTVCPNAYGQPERLSRFQQYRRVSFDLTEAFGRSLGIAKSELTDHFAFFDQGRTYGLRLPILDFHRCSGFATISQKYSRMKYGRLPKFLLSEIDLSLGMGSENAAQRRLYEEFYAAACCEVPDYDRFIPDA